jgi:hypothetical protein
VMDILILMISVLLKTQSSSSRGKVVEGACI